MASFRDRFLTPKVARAITSPSAIVATGAGAAVGILALGTPVGAVAFGLAAFAARVLAAVPRAPRHPNMDPRRLQDPWRTIMVEILDADRRFDRAVSGIRPGPLRERVTELGSRLERAVAEAWRTAEAGAQLSNGRAQIDTNRIHHELAAAQQGPQTERTQQTVAAIQAQLAAADRLDHTIRDAYDRLRLLDARIDETVTRTVELSVTQTDVEALAGLGDEVDSIVDDMEALRQAVEETRATHPQLPGGGTPPPRPDDLPDTGQTGTSTA
jgi:hypothetical protein